MTKKIKIIADESMPAIEQLFSSVANLVKISGRKITNQQLSNADALICRSTCLVNRKLVENTPIKFIGTATIGIDHLDTSWLDKNKIPWANAAGCNAEAVAQYVLSAMAYWCRTNDKDITSLRVGIIGAGNVGTALAKHLDKLQISYLLSDPPLEEKGDRRNFSSLLDILSCDVVTIHVPLVKTGKYSTYHMFDEQLFKSLGSEQLLINAARGSVIDNLVLENYLQKSDSAQVVLDVFENEPNISKKLVKQSLLATPHIAGHTLEGKLRGSYLVYKAFCNYFNLPIAIEEDSLYPAKNRLDSSSSDLEGCLLDIYDIESQSNLFKLANTEELPSRFDKLRKNATQLQF